MKRFFIMLLVAISCSAMAEKTYLLQTEWDQTNYNSLLPYFNDGTHVLSGCTSVAAAQVINYYGWLPEYAASFHLDVTDTVSGWPAGAVEVRDDYHNVWYWSGTYHVDSMPCSPDSLIASVFYSEANLIERNATATSSWTLYGSFNNHYSYDVDAYITDEYSNASELVFCQVVPTTQLKALTQQAIAAGKPVIVNGESHSFIIDGYDAETDEFHFNLGWGPGRNFWGGFRSWADGRYSIFIVTPNRNKAVMPEISVEDSIPLHVRNIDTGEDHIGYLTSGLYFDFEDRFSEFVYPGSYEIWLEFPDGKILAPELTSNVKCFADTVLGITSYSLMHNKAVLHVRDTADYGTYIQLDIYYNTTMGYFDMRFSDKVREERFNSNNLTVVCDGVTYRMVRQNRDYHTVPIRMKRDSVIRWLAYYQDIPFGNVGDSHYQNAIPFTNAYERIMLRPSQTEGENDYLADYVSEYGTEGSAVVGGFGVYNSTRPFQMRTPSQVYMLDEANYDYYSGLSSLLSIQSEDVYMGFLFDCNGARMFAYNRVPVAYDFPTGVAFIVDDSITTYPLAQGSPITAPADPRKVGYNFLGWEPALAPDAVVPNGVAEYHALFEKGDYQFYKSFSYLLGSREPDSAMIVLTFADMQIDSISVSADGVRDGVCIAPFYTAVKICCNDVPAAWEPRGFVSGTVLGLWQNVDGVRTLTITDWNDITYEPKLPVEDGYYYLYNEGAQAYICFGASSTTLSAVDGAGARVWLSPNGKKYYMWHEGLPGATHFSLEAAADSTYLLSNDDGLYYHWAGGVGLHGDDVLAGEKGNTADYRWRVIPADRYEALAVGDDATRYITNPDFSASADACTGWTGDWTLSGAAEAQVPLCSGIFATIQTAADSLGTVELSQSITLPIGSYRLTAYAGSLRDSLAATHAYLFAGAAQTAVGLLDTCSVVFYSNGRPLSIGIRAANSSARLISVDRFRLTYLGEPVVSFPTMSISYNDSTLELTFTPSDKQAYYMVMNNPAADWTSWGYNADTYFSDLASGFTMEDLKTYYGRYLLQGDQTIYMGNYLVTGQTGNWLAFTNFVDSVTMSVSSTTRCEYTLEQSTSPGGDTIPGPVITFPTISISYNPETMDLTFTPSDKQAYYLVTCELVSNLTEWNMDDTYHSVVVGWFPDWTSMYELFSGTDMLHQGDHTIYMGNYLVMGQTGDWLAFANFVDTATLAVSPTFRCEFTLGTVPTDIPVIRSADDSAIYDIMGRRVSDLLPGRIYIIGGKKHLHH